jgi:uncharacterized protein (DUF1810 family)
MASELLNTMAQQLESIHLRGARTHSNIGSEKKGARSESTSGTGSISERDLSTSSDSSSIVCPGSRAASRLAAKQADPFLIRERFCVKQKQDFDGALREIKAGQKRSCWSWWIFPVGPWVVNGRERGSGTNKEYALRDQPPNHLRADDAVHAYLRFPETHGVNLRANYITIMHEVALQIEGGISCGSLVGRLDEPKLRSSLKLFERVTRRGFDDEVNETCIRALAAMQEKLDDAGDSEDNGDRSQ